jgi:phosphatidate cytidylyltransferase
MATNTRLLSDTNFRRRVTTALIGMPTILLVIVFGTPFWDAMVIGTSLYCVVELQRMISPNSRAGLLGMAAIVLSCFLSFRLNTPLPLIIAISAFALFQLTRVLGVAESKREFLIRHNFQATLGALYLGLPLAMLYMIRFADQGIQWIMLIFFTNWATDSFALIGGRLFGRTKLAPTISPGKTREGAVIGVTVGFLIGLVTGHLFNLPQPVATIAPAAIALLTLFGDLLESWIKRYFAVKDAGDILPGHGGLLDRVDGMLLAAPALYLLLALFIK